MRCTRRFTMKRKGEEYCPGSRSLRRRYVVTFATAILLGALYSLIFCFSAQDGGESGSLSRMLSGKCAEFLRFLSGSRWSDGQVRELAEALEYPLRKLAHFSEYACMGILVYVLWSQWLAQGKKLWLLAALWVFCSAAGDEFHQFFVPGRCASFADVLLDTCGGVCGIFFSVTVRRLCGWLRRRRLRKGCLRHSLKL